VTLGAVAAGGWFLWVPEWRPSLRDGERYGIDVSAHQGEIDWERVADDGIAVAYVKATEGGDFVDERFAENWDGAAAAGLERGAYHFFTFCRGGRTQADHFLDVAPPREDALAPAVDLEIAGNCADAPDIGELYHELDLFLTKVEAEWGRPVVLYVGDDFDRAYDLRYDTENPLWLRRLWRRPSGDWQIWQVSGWAHVDGIDGSVDLDVVRQTSEP
jgi:lysozyme